MAMIFEARIGDDIVEYVSRALQFAKEQNIPLTLRWNENFRTEIQPDSTVQQAMSAFHEHSQPEVTNAALKSIGEILIRISDLDATVLYKLAFELHKLKNKICP